MRSKRKLAQQQPRPELSSSQVINDKGFIYEAFMSSESFISAKFKGQTLSQTFGQRIT